ncbi:MAG: MobV family relaxase [Mariprofundaceae bacterium]|nr:MobV family relaxase [Mariprofundaceae bacterium]
MKQYAILRTVKLKTFGNVAGSSAHVNRTLQEDQPNINPSRKHLNQTLVGSGNPFADVKASLPDKYRKNAVLAVEVLMTATPDFFQGKTKKEIDKWADESIKSAGKFWGTGNVVSAVLHMDEETPHLHLHIVPKVNDKLNCREFIGGKAKLSKMQTEYADDMKPFGLLRGIEGSKAKHRTPGQVDGEAKTQPKLKSRKVEVVTGRESTLLGLSEKVNSKKVTFPTVESARATEAEAAKVPLLKRRVDSLTETIEDKTKQVDSFRTKATVSALRDMPLIEICQNFGYIQNEKDPAKWKTPVGTISITDKKFFDHSAGVGGGGAIDLLMHTEGVDFKQSVEMIASGISAYYAASAVSQRACQQVGASIQKPNKIQKPNSDPSLIPKLEEWLTSTRKIPMSMAQNWIDSGKVYASKFHDSWQAIFVHGKNAFNRVNPNTDFKGWVYGSTVDDVMFTSEPCRTKPTAIVEGHLDGMALEALRPDLNVAIAGSSGSVPKFAEELKKNGHSVLLAVDNDPAGRAIIEKLPQYEAIKPISKDWNQDLIDLDADDGSNAPTSDLTHSRFRL